MALPVVVVNPSSAGGKTRAKWPQHEAAIRDALGDFRALFTERPGHGTELTRQALEDGADLVLAMGGDGTINEVVNGFFTVDGAESRSVRPGAAFGVLPAGTGGDFVKTLGSPKLLVDAARAIRSARPRALDAARLEYTDEAGKPKVRHFINIASFGIGGQVDRYVNQSSKLLGGKGSFFLATLRATASYRNQPCRIRFDGGAPVERTIYSVAVANGRFFGGGMQMAPGALPDDGQFDVVTIGDVSMATMMLHTAKIYRGTHVALPFVTVERAAVVSAEPVDARAEVLLDVDGEQPGRLPATFRILPGAIPVVA